MWAKLIRLRVQSTWGLSRKRWRSFLFYKRRDSFCWWTDISFWSMILFYVCRTVPFLPDLHHCRYHIIRRFVTARTAWAMYVQHSFMTALNDVSTVEWLVDTTKKYIGEELTVNEGKNIPDHVPHNTLKLSQARNPFCVAVFSLLLISLSFFIIYFANLSYETFRARKGFLSPNLRH
jgi:hypothetical protein